MKNAVVPYGLIATGSLLGIIYFGILVTTLILIIMGIIYLNQEINKNNKNK
jgi:hypothetical protein